MSALSAKSYIILLLIAFCCTRLCAELREPMALGVQTEDNHRQRDAERHTDLSAGSSPSAPAISQTGFHAPQLALKTNAVMWALFISNLSIEADFAPHWGFNFPFYYSAWNYGVSTICFRTFTMQPAFRYFITSNNDGWFVQAHLGISWYNMAVNGRYRQQDHGGVSPAIGGGVGFGYCLPLSRDGRWQMECELSVGAYALMNDTFLNYENGPLVNTEQKSYYGVDQLSISFGYYFDLQKR